MGFEYANRLKMLPPYLFAEIEEKVERKRKKGVDIIDFGIGDPDLPTPRPIVEFIQRELEDPENHRYPSSAGEAETRKAIADWYRKRFGVKLDPQGEVAVLIGSKEGLANICRAFVNPGEKVLAPDPAYPVYAQGAALLTDAVPLRFPLLAEKGFLPDIESLDTEARMLYLNYPNNPTGAVVDKRFLLTASRWCQETDTIFCYDNAYSEMTFDDYVAPSALEVAQGDGTIEFHSLSKTFNMTGYRVGFAVGDSDLIAGLKKVKSQIDSGTPKFLQSSVTMALGAYRGAEKPQMVKDNIAVYQERRDVLVNGLRKLGYKVDPPKATFYLWMKVDEPSLRFAERMLETGIVVTPGIGFGKYGEGYVRMATTQSVQRIEQALERMAKGV
jgi:LL-diaminopimelate aminotransferase